MPAIDDLELETVSFELRYSNSYLLWDTAGIIWSKMLGKHPELTSVSGAPNQQVFDADTLQLTLEVGSCKVVGRGPDAIDRVAAVAADFYPIVAQHLTLTSFTRAGFRLIKFKAFTNSEEAMAFAQENGLVALDTPKGFGNKTAFATSHRFETETSGLFATLKIEEKQLNITIPWDGRFLLQSVNSKRTLFIADADFYTIGVIDRETLDIETWIRQASKGIRRYWETL
jgi:hypothetical protein